jgi:hypothetical protein
MGYIVVDARQLECTDRRLLFRATVQSRDGLRLARAKAVTGSLMKWRCNLAAFEELAVRFMIDLGITVAGITAILARVVKNSTHLGVTNSKSAACSNSPDCVST